MALKLLLISTLLVILLSSLSLAAGSISIASVSLPTSVTQGNSFTITMSVSGSQASDVKGSLTLPSGLTCSPTSTQSISLSGSGTGSASWSCTADVAGDYTNKITASATATDSGTGGSLSDSKQTGLKVLTPASLTVSSTIQSGSLFFTVGVNNVGDTDTTFSYTVSCPSGLTCSPSSGSNVPVSGKSLVNQQVSLSGSAGTYTVSATVSSPNQPDQTTSKSVTITGAVTTPSTTTGGGAAVSTPSKNITIDKEAVAKVTVSKGKAVVEIPSIAASKSAVVSITKTEDVSFREIIITVKNSVSSIKVTVTKLDARPAYVVKETTGGHVFNYIEVDKSNITDSDIDSVTIDFSVSKSWIAANNIDTGTVALERYDGSEWKKLTTSRTGEDDQEVHFQSESPGLSVFAVTGDVKSAVSPPAEEEKPAAEEPQPAFGMTAAIIIIIVVAGGAGFYFARKHFKK